MRVIFLPPGYSYVMPVSFHKTPIDLFLLLRNILVYFLLLFLNLMQAPMAIHRECLQHLLFSSHHTACSLDLLYRVIFRYKTFNWSIRENVKDQKTCQQNEWNEVHRLLCIATQLWIFVYFLFLFLPLMLLLCTDS